MKGFLAVNAFFILFAAVTGGALFIAAYAVKALNLSDDLERTAMAAAGLTALVVGGLVMKQLHAMIQRRM